LVPFGQSKLLEDALKKANAEVSLVPLPNAGHGGPAFHRPEITKQMIGFFDKHLKR